MPWWGWIVVGAALLAGEMVVDTQFYLVFFGVAALVTGGLAMLGLTGPAWLQWAIFGALCVAGTLGFRRRLYGMLRAGAVEVSQGTVGELAIARSEIAPGARGQAELRGTVWEARNTGAAPIAAGERVRVERVEGLVLSLRRES
jgi:membrane protein implicated in regulation of membrane protease activity